VFGNSRLYSGLTARHWRSTCGTVTPGRRIPVSVPRELAHLALQNKKGIFNLLFRASVEILLEVARDSHHLVAGIGLFSVLPTWDQRLLLHPHVHCALASGLAPDHARWMSSSRRFLPDSSPEINVEPIASALY